MFNVSAQGAGAVAQCCHLELMTFGTG